MKIGIIVGSTRQNRAGLAVGQWVLEQAQSRTEASYELVDLAEFDVPLLSTPVPPAMLGGNYPEPEIARWAETMASFDGYVFVTAEYNHAAPGVFKNAIDVLGSEIAKKAVAFVSYGAAGGLLAVENWRGILANFNVYDIRNVVALNIFTEMGENGLNPDARRTQEIADLFDTLEPATKAMATLR